MNDQDNVINMGQRKTAAEPEKFQTASQAINNPDVPDYLINQMIDDEFPVITETVPLPSKGVFYKNKQSSIKIKHLTAEDENILTSPDLIFLTSEIIFKSSGPIPSIGEILPPST